MRFGFGAFLAPFVLVGVEVGGLLGEEALRLVSDILSGFDAHKDERGQERAEPKPQ